MGELYADCRFSQTSEPSFISMLRLICDKISILVIENSIFLSFVKEFIDIDRQV
ncbi:hypothetical protein J2Z22_003926 [Paenibacillus forsythiae]|uniref:Resolvase/invertase-type recombinase catalytic domain-containing protein n=1 Tax=Paenibacillus forsythiae TaxID=365616 RepID=A0ABU3HBY0_9BACL|nr:hypothetical protein [Paenibacillus forsythiae]